tara:strand:+ start:8360 stop:8662 length:303 start_codon:yes stop_codon:yes gene_type:complete
MELSEFIKENYSGKQCLFAEASGISASQVCNYKSRGNCSVFMHDGKIVLTNIKKHLELGEVVESRFVQSEVERLARQADDKALAVLRVIIDQEIKGRENG